MADLLGSILGQMEKPPTMGAEERKKANEQRMRIEKQQRQEKEKLKHFRMKMQKVINDFLKDSEAKSYKFDPMEKVHRAILHDITDVAGLTSFSFGQEEVDRYVMLWKKEFAPCDEELSALRNGEVYDPTKTTSKQKELLASEAVSTVSETVAPQCSYQDKYQRLLSGAENKQEASVASTRSYGLVNSENKRDRRTIEEVLADSRAKKKQKT